MSETKHTPGPWRVVAADDYEVHSNATPTKYPHRDKRDDLGRFVAIIGNRAPDYGMADACLVAAAPELLAALKDILSADQEFRTTLPHGAMKDKLTLACEAAIEVVAKAEGRP